MLRTLRRGGERLLALGLLLGVPIVATAQEVPGSRWVSNEAFFYAEVPHPVSAIDRATSDRVASLLKAVPGYQKALEGPDVRKVFDVVNLVASQLGTTWDKAARDLTGGGIVVAAEGTNAPDRVFLVMTPSDVAFAEKAHAKLLELARADATSKGNPDPIKENEHRGVKAYSVGANEAHAIVNGSLVIANSGETLKVVIDRALDGKTSSIVEDPSFSERHKQATPDTLAWAFARTDRLRTLDPKRYAAKPDAGATFLFGPWTEAALKGDWAALGLTWTESKMAAELSLATPKDGYSDAMKRYLPAKGSGAPRPVSVPNAIGGASLWRDLSSIWEVRAEIFPPETVQGLAQLDTTAGTFFGGRDFGTGVLGALASRWNIVIADQDFAKMDPVPDVKYPAFAVILELKPDDEEFATRLKSAFQSFIGLVNLGAAQTKAQPLMLGSDSVDGLSISTSRYLPEKGKAKGEPVNARYNFSPSAVQVGNYFVVSSNLQLAKDLVPALKAEPGSTESTLLAEVSGSALASILDRNRERLVMQNMLEKGNAKEQSEGEIQLLLNLLRYLGRASLSAADRDDSAIFNLDFQLDAK